MLLKIGNLFQILFTTSCCLKCNVIRNDKRGITSHHVQIKDATLLM